MKVETFKCDNCEALRKEANHWWRAWRLKAGGLLILPFDDTHPVAQTVADAVVPGSNVDLCGENCVAQFVSKNLNSDK